MLKAITTFIALLVGSTLTHSQHNTVPTEILWKNEMYGMYNSFDEIVSLRTSNSKSFRSGDKIVAVSAAGAINYFEDFQWKTIFHTIVPTSD